MQSEKSSKMSLLEKAHTLEQMEMELLQCQDKFNELTQQKKNLEDRYKKIEKDYNMLLEENNQHLSTIANLQSSQQTTQFDSNQEIQDLNESHNHNLNNVKNKYEEEINKLKNEINSIKNKEENQHKEWNVKTNMSLKQKEEELILIKNEEINTIKNELNLIFSKEIEKLNELINNLKMEKEQLSNELKNAPSLSIVENLANETQKNQLLTNERNALNEKYNQLLTENNNVKTVHQKILTENENDKKKIE